MIVSSSLISVLVFCFQVAGYSRKVQAKRRSPYTQEEAHWLADEGSGCPLDDPDCFDRQMSSGDNRLDYPPVAVVERDMSIDWLQLKPVILYGNASTDDHGIVSYLWAKLQGGAVTMQGIHTPFLHISDLERDAYIFSLTVTDTNDQQSSDVARVFVRGGKFLHQSRLLIAKR
ncbi:PREDICTED: dyslexia-associated protein KIAA0319 homolog [Priapulus caudatus]|uniref:Dyslexia-associated protein KIAA0319 homolog n=1 Tax=Priapulus caudatus TaxID=37621 RepID=A0ABM1E5G5_PRICU|nr:PREDICTED: dyslexia-associated protein KIAA0319 homolog [Priapulus caudatus]